jgi:hypothetical protein
MNFNVRMFTVSVEQINKYEQVVIFTGDPGVVFNRLSLGVSVVKADINDITGVN